MAENVPKAMTPSAFTPFGGEFDQLFNRMVRAWSFGFLEPVGNGHLRALHSAEHAPKSAQKPPKPDAKSEGEKEAP